MAPCMHNLAAPQIYRCCPLYPPSENSLDPPLVTTIPGTRERMLQWNRSERPPNYRSATRNRPRIVGQERLLDGRGVRPASAALTGRRSREGEEDLLSGPPCLHGDDFSWVHCIYIPKPSSSTGIEFESQKAQFTVDKLFQSMFLATCYLII